MKTLVVSGLAPSNKDWPGFYLSQVCKQLAIRNRDITVILKSIKLRSELGYRYRYLPFKLRFVSSFFFELKRKYVEVPRHGKSLLKFAQEEFVDEIIVTMDGQTCVWIAEYLLKRKVIPVRILNFDSAESIGVVHKLDRFSKAFLRSSYQFCLKRGEVVQNLFMPLDGTLNMSNKVSTLLKHRADRVVIGIGGNVFQTETIKALISALDSIYWELDGKKIEIRYWGHGELPVRRTRIHQRHLEDCATVIDLFGDCDILYLPYWFDSHFIGAKEENGWALLAAYIASKAVIFYHGSNRSEIAYFLQAHGAGIVCASLESEVIKMNLRKAIYAPSGPVATNANAL